MTRQLEDVERDSPRASKILVALFSAILAFVVFALGWQQWVYSQNKDDMKVWESRYEELIRSLQNRQDILRQRHEDLVAENTRQDLRMAKDYVTLERYSCDMKDLKDTVKEGFKRLDAQLNEPNRLGKTNLDARGGR